MSVVVLRALGLGDLLTAVPALRALRDHWPQRRITVACPAPLAPLVRLTGCAHHPARPLAPLDAPLHDADLLVNLHGRGPQSHRVALDARPRALVAFCHAEVPETAGAPQWRPGEHEVERWCRLLTESGIPAEPSRLGLRPPPLPPRLADVRGAVVVHPGAASPARRWPPDRFAEVAAAQSREGRRVVVTGGPGERDLAAEVARRASLPAGALLAGRTDLTDLAAVVGAAARVVCGDTGVAHLATAFGVPSVLLFGPTSPDEWGPLTTAAADARHRVIWRGGRGDPHADTPDPGLLAIDTDLVLRELEALPA